MSTPATIQILSGLTQDQLKTLIGQSPIVNTTYDPTYTYIQVSGIPAGAVYFLQVLGADGKTWNSLGYTITPPPPGRPFILQGPFDQRTWSALPSHTFRVYYIGPNGQPIYSSQTSAPPPSGGGTTQPPPSGGGTTQPPPSSTSFPIFPDSLNPKDWVNWLGQVIQWGFMNIWIGLVTIVTQIVQALWSFLPQKWRDNLLYWMQVGKNIADYFNNPNEFYSKHAGALWTAGSPAAIPSYIASTTAFAKTQTSDAAKKTGDNWGIQKQITDAIQAPMDTVKGYFDDKIDPETAITTAQKVSDEAIGLTSLVGAINVALELIPTENFTGIAFLTTTMLAAFGIPGYINDYYYTRWQKNVVLPMGYLLNEKYPQALPSIGELERLINVGKLTPDEWTKYGPRVTGITADWLNKSRLAKHQVPTIDDFIEWNIRHPDQPFDLNANSDLLDTNMTDYGKYFLERQYAGVSMRYVQAAFDVLDFNEIQIRELLRLTRIDPRQNTILKMSPADVMVKVVMNRKGLTEGIKAVTSKTQLYVIGQASREDLLALTTKVFASQEARDYSMSYADDEKAKHDAKVKHFTYSQLVKFAEAGVDMTSFIDGDIAASGFDAAHQTALKSYIQKAIATNQAKTASTTTPTTG